MGLVDGEHIGTPLAEKLRRTGTHEPFRRDIEEAIAAPPEARLDRRSVFATVR